MSRKRILLTGAAGRVGRLVRPQLQQAYALRLCDLAPPAVEAGDDELCVGDLAEPLIARAAVDGVAAVVHLAGLHPPAPLNESAPVAPDGFYGLSKAFGEAACVLYARRFGLRTLVIRIGNADPEVVDGRRERMWISGRDLTQLIAIGIEPPDVACEIVHGTSHCPNPLFSDGNAHRLGYRPQDRADDHHATHFRPLARMTAADGVDHVGGLFCTAPLPPPFLRT